MIKATLLGGLLALSAVIARAEAPCGGDVACQVGDGDYRIASPENGPAKGAYVFFHGYKGSAALTMRDDRALIDVALAHGLAFAAVDGRDGTWSVPGAPSHDRDEQAFVGRVLDDLDARFGFTAADIVLGGFSQGASMAWYTVCFQGGRAAGMVTFSGVFWDPSPEAGDCVAEAPPVVHFHGTADRTFPLAGRAVGAGFHQGDTFESIRILRESAGCHPGAAEPVTLDRISCRMATGCRRGAITLCAHDGGHRTDPGQLDAGLDQIGFR